MKSWGKPKQLYTLVDALTKRSRKADDVNLITGLVIVHSLEQLTLGGESNAKFQEVRQVYRGMDDVVGLMGESSPNVIINKYRGQVKTILQNPQKSNSHKASGSYLLRTTLRSLKRGGQGSYSDQLRSRASGLIHNLKDFGPVSGEAYAMERDHHFLEAYFAGGNR